MSHHVSVCEYGFMHSQCRCISKDKEVRRIKCNRVGLHEGLIGPYGVDPSQYKPKHRLDGPAQ